MDAQTLFEDAKHFGLFGMFFGLLCGIAYGIGGFFVDLFTTGLNYGTVLALAAVPSMPLLALPFGVVAGLLWSPIYHKVPRRFGGSR